MERNYFIALFKERRWDLKYLLKYFKIRITLKKSIQINKAIQSRHNSFFYVDSWFNSLVGYLLEMYNFAGKSIVLLF